MSQTDQAIRAGEAEGMCAGREQLRVQRMQAQAVLDELLRAEADCLAHGERLRRADLFRTVTGRSPFDSAIASTRRMIEQIDRALGCAGLEVQIRVRTLQGGDGLLARSSRSR